MVKIIIRDRSKTFNEKDAPNATYYINADGGEYDVWAKLYAWGNDQMNFGVSVDAETFRFSNKDWKIQPWKYSSEHVWKWVYVARFKLEQGTHTMKFTGYHGGLRAEAFELEKQ